MERIKKAEKYLAHWQRSLNLQEWDFDIKFKDFKRDDYPQSGDIEVDLENKKATIFLIEDSVNKDNVTILHELIHLILWGYDHFSESFIPENDKDEYFTYLEKVAADLTKILLERDPRS